MKNKIFLSNDEGYLKLIAYILSKGGEKKFKKMVDNPDQVSYNGINNKETAQKQRIKIF